jgi:protein-tyrosine phosphatase
VAGSVLLPSGAVIRGRRLADPPDGEADFLLALADGPLPPWPHRRIRWPDFWVPTDRDDALDGLTEVLRRARAGQRVEIACRGGRGRTGTALAALAVLAGLPPAQAVSRVREHYDPKAVEVPWQAWWVRRLGSAMRSDGP